MSHASIRKKGRYGLMLLDFLKQFEDKHNGKGKRYDLRHILFFYPDHFMRMCAESYFFDKI
jgi:hypothetical protein